MDIKDSYLHGTVGVVKSISVSADKLKYTLADIAGTVREVTLPVATTSANGLMSSGDKLKLDNLSTTLGNYVTLNTDQEITGTKTFTKQLKFTVAKGTAPFLVTSDTKVDNLNAAMLDGLDSSRYLHSVAYDANLDFNVVKGINNNGGCVTNANYILSGDNQLSNSPYSYGIMTTLNNGAAGMDFATNGPLGFTIGLKFRKRWLNNLSEWKEIAFTDSNITGNAATATHASTADKLKTKRKLWGLDFDGSADVSGDMTGVGIINTIFNLKTQSGNASLYLETATANTDYAHIFVSNKNDNKTHASRPLVLQYGYGNVGIGAPEPTHKLTVNGDVKATSFIGNLDGTYVNKLTNYSKATAIGAIAATDSLNTALGKLEYKADAAYDLVKGAYDGDGTIENLAEILKVLEGIKDTETIQAIIGKYLPLTGGTLTGSLSVQDASVNVRSDKAQLRFLSAGDITYIESGNAAFNDNAPLKITGYNGFTGSDLYLLFNRIYCRGGNYTNLDSGNTYINNGAITINGTSITPLTSHQSLANYVTLNTDLTITGVKTFSSLQKFTVAEGTSPFLVTSSTIVSNLNANYINGYLSSQIFKELGWNSSATFTDCDATGRSYGLIINQSGNYTNVLNYPHTFGFVLNFLSGGDHYTGVLMSINSAGDNIKIRDRWSSGSWNVWRTLIHDGNYGSYLGYIGTTPVLKTQAIQTLNGIQSIGMSGSITMYTPGNGTYDIATIRALDSDGYFSIEAPLKTDSSTADRLPIVLSWCGGYPTKGGLKLTGGTDGYLGGKKILHEGNYSSYLALSNAATADKLKTARTLTVGDTGKLFDGSANISWNSTEIGFRHEWDAIVKGVTWSRLCYVSKKVSTEGSAFILNISATRSSVVYNNTYLVTAHHGAGEGQIVLIGGSHYSALEARVLTNSGGDSYVEIKDSAYSVSSSTTLLVHCRLIPLACGAITKYTAFTDGTTLPSGFSSGTILHTKSYANSILATNFVGNLIGNVTGDLTGNASSATKLQTARKLWGNDFDGSTDVSGNMTGVGIVNSIFEVSKGSGNAKLNVTSISSDRDYLSLYVSSNTSTNTTTRPLVIQHGYGNVGIGVIAPSEKLEINGNVKATKFITTGGTSTHFVKGDGSLDSNTYATTSSLSNYVTLTGNLTISGVKTFSTLQQFTIADGTSPFAVTSQTKVTNLNADMLDGVHLAGYGGREGVMRSWKRGTYTTVDLYFGNGNIIVIDPKPTDSTELSANTIIFSLGEVSTRNTLLAFLYESNTIKYRRATGESSVTWNSWVTLMHSGNYTNYTVKKDGTGATGTWGINITGSAGSVDWSNIISKPNLFTNFGGKSVDFNFSDNNNNNGIYYLHDNYTQSNKNGITYGSIVNFSVSASSWQLLSSGESKLYYRLQWWSGGGGTWSDWKQLAFTSDIPTVTDYYWANIKIKSAEDKTTVPTFGGINSTGTITDSSAQPLAFTSTGTGVYTRAALIHNTSGTVFERARATESSSGNILPFIISLRGGGTAASFEGNNLYIAGKVGIGTSVSTSALDVKGNVIFQNNTNLVTFELKGPNSKLAMLTWSDSNYIESGNSDFSKNLPLKLTGIAGGLGSDLYLSFANIYCRAGYTNIDSNNYTTYTVTKTGGGASGTWGINISGDASTLRSLAPVYNKLYYNAKSVTMSTTLVTWYIKIVLSAYALPCQFMIGGSYNNQIDRAIIETSGMSQGYIYRNCNQNNGNITGIWHKSNYDSSEKKWIFWIRLKAIQDSTTSHYSPSSSATYTVYMSEKNDAFTVTATTTGPSDAVWVATGSDYNNIIIKNAYLSGTASSATNADTLDGYHASAFQLAGNYLIDHGMSNSRPNGTTFTLPGGSNGVSMRSKATSGNDIGIFLLTDDNAFICNSSDNNYLFATFDTDKTADFSNANNAAFAVLSDHAGVSIKGLVTMDGYFNIKNHYFFVRDNANADWIITDKSWQHEYAIIHSGNIGSQSVNYATSAGSASSASSATTASIAAEARVLCADASMKLYANHSNEINFGGTNTSGTIYFGYRATDSKPVPTSFVFGDSTGSATITSSGFKKKGSSDSYVLLGGGGHKTESSLSVSYASSAGSASSASSATDSDKLDGYHESSFFRYRGVLTNNANFNDYYNGSYVNTTGNGSGNSNNPISYGYLVSFPGSGSGAYYAGWLFSASTTGLQFRGHWNYAWSSWVTVITNQNIGSLSVNYASSAGSVAWGNITGKPSFFSGNYNDLTNKPTSLPANGGTATAAYYVYDYNATTTPIYIGYAGAGLSTATHFAAYGTTSSGARCIKDLSVANAKSVLGIPTVYARDIGVNGNNWTFYSSTNAATTSIYAPTSVGTNGYILQSLGNGAPSWTSRLSYSYPGVIWIGYIYRSLRTYTTWYASTLAGSATVTMYISSPSSTNNYQVALQSSTHTIIGGMCSIQAQFNAGKDGGQTTEGPLYAYSTVDVSKIEEAGPDVLVSTVYSGRFYIKAMRASDANNSSYYFDGLAFTGAGKDTNSLPLARINVILFGY